MLDRLEAVIAIDWTAVFSFFAYITSSAALPISSRLLLTDLQFPFPATMAAVHVTAVSICLVFWTLFSVFKPRIIRVRHLLPLSLMHALVSLSHVQNLYRNSLLHYQLARFVPLLSLSWERSAESSEPDSGSAIVRTRRARVTRAIFSTVSCALILLHPPTSPFFFATAVVVPLFDQTGYPRQLSANTRATDLQLQLFTRSLSAAFLCVVAPVLDTNYNTGLLHLMSSMITDLGRPSSFFLCSSSLLAFFTFVSVRVAHAKLEPYVFRTASILGAAPTLLLHFAMEHWSAVLDTTTGPYATSDLIAVVRSCVDVALVLLLLATLHYITVSTIPGYDSENTGRLDDEGVGDLGARSDVNDNTHDRFRGDGGTLLRRDGSRTGIGSDDYDENDEQNYSPSPTSESIPEWEYIARPLQVESTTGPSTMVNNLEDHSGNRYTIHVSSNQS